MATKIVFLHLTMGLNNRGSEKAVDTLAAALAQKHRITVIQGGPVQAKSYRVIHPLTLKRLPPVAPKNLWQKLLFRLYRDPFSRLVGAFTRHSVRHLKSINPDIIIPINGALQVKIIKAAFPDKKIVCFGHAGMGYHDRAVLKQKPDLFVALSQPAYQWAKNLAIGQTFVLHCPNPFSPTGYNTALPVKPELPRPIIISVGALTGYKNHALLIKTLAPTQASLIILGEGEEKASLEKLAGRYLPKRCLVRSVKPNEVPTYLKTADVFCLLSQPQEAFGLVYLEAMAAGLPVIAPDDPIRRSIIGRNGYFTRLNENAIRQTIRRAVGKKPINYQQELLAYKPKIIAAKLSLHFQALLKSK